MASKERLSYWQIFRLIFVVFSLYLMGDAFYRWDGFRYHSTFIEFLPSVALATILWSIVAVFTAILVWLPLRTLEWFCLRMGWKIRTKPFLMFIYIFVFLATTAWIAKKILIPNVHATLLRIIVFLCVTLATIFLAWLFRYKADRWIGIIQERITPLVWLFGFLIILSVPLVAYHTWGIASQEITKSSIIVDKKNRPNIILITFDALTARNMSAYGYHRPTTPFISEWAKTASLFAMAEAEDTYTISTTASLMTGKRLWTHQSYHVVGSSKPVRSDIESLPLMLKKNGYYNMAFIANSVASVKTLGVSNSFEIAPRSSEFVVINSLLGAIDVTLYRLFSDKIKLYNWILKKDFILHRFAGVISQDYHRTRFPAENVFKKVLAVLNNSLPEPFFAWIHLNPPHDPYLPPEPYKGMFDSSPDSRTWKSELKARFKIREYRQQLSLPLQEIQSIVNTLRARYDEYIVYCDKQLENFIIQLTRRNMLKNTVIILSADHGENFELSGAVGRHGGPPKEPLTHIPLIIKEPNQTKGRIINALVEQIDIPATILDLANIPIPSWMEGRSLVPLMQGKRLSTRPAFSMSLHKNPSRGHQITKGTIAVWEGDYKLIHYLEDKKSLLFNLREDPDELNNLFDEKIEVGHHLLGLIKDNLKKANERISRGE